MTEALSRKLPACLLCGSEKLEVAVALAPISVTTPDVRVGAGWTGAQELNNGVPLDLMRCAACGQMQLSHVLNKEFVYRNFIYTTSLSTGLDEHFSQYADAAFAAHSLAAGDQIVEVGSNDGTLLRFFKAKGARVIGIEPGRKIAGAATENGIPTLPEFFSSELAERIVCEHGEAKLVIANWVFANVEDLQDFAKGVRALLSRDGVCMIETQYGVDVAERNLLDTVYHEHISYFMVGPLQTYFARHGLRVIDVIRVPTKGGGIRLTLDRADTASHTRNPSVDTFLAEEEAKNAYSESFYIPWRERIARVRREVHERVNEATAGGGRVAGWGVSVGTSALLPQLELTDGIEYLVDDDPRKENELRGPGYRIPVRPATSIYEDRPAAIVVFAWRYIDAIASKHARYLDEGGTFIIPLPDVRILTATKARSA